MLFECHSSLTSIFDSVVFLWFKLYLLLSSVDAVVSMVISAKTIVETCVIVAVCVDPGVGGQIELELVVTLTASDLKAGKRFAREFLACFCNRYFNAAFQVEIYTLIAVEAEDFTVPSPFTITFPVGTPTSDCATITIIDDTVLEGNHDFSVSIDSAGMFAMIGTPDTTVFTIDDDESKSSALLLSLLCTPTPSALKHK